MEVDISCSQCGKDVNDAICERCYEDAIGERDSKQEEIEDLEEQINKSEAIEFQALLSDLASLLPKSLAPLMMEKFLKDEKAVEGERKLWRKFVNTILQRGVEETDIKTFYQPCPTCGSRIYGIPDKERSENEKSQCNEEKHQEASQESR